MSETLVNQIDNKNIYASRAVADEDGTNIKTNYALKSEIPTVPTMKNLVAGTNVSITETANGIEISASGGGGTQVQADWTEQDSTDPSYIQNKPVQKTITAGTGIAITESQNSFSVYTDPNVVPTKTEMNTALAGKQDTLTAGAGIAISNINVISVDKTVLWEGSSRTNIQLSETITNFEEIAVYYDEDGNGVRLAKSQATPINSSSLGLCGTNYFVDDTGNPIHIDAIELSISNGVVSIASANSKYMSATGTAIGNWDIAGVMLIKKIVGINRKASN